MLSFSLIQLFMKRFLFLALSTAVLFSCTDDREKAASEYCSCFRTKEKKFSSDFKKLMGKVAQSDDPQKTLQKEVNKMDDETKLTVSEEMQSLQNIESDPVMKKCEKLIADFKVRGKDESARLKVVFEEMRKQKNCEVLTGLIALGIQQQDKIKNGDTATDDEEEAKPMKKKKTETEEE